MEARVQRHRLASVTADAILDRIRSGEWSLGAQLPGETTLAAQLEVGRSTLREAVRELAGKGVLESRQGVGVFVTARDPGDDWDVVLRRADAVAVIEARLAIETEAASLAAQRRTPVDIRALRRTLAQRADHEAPSVADHVDADMRLHRAVVCAAHNDVLLELFDAFVPRVRRAMVDVLRVRPLASAQSDHDAHASLVAAIVDRDAPGAGTASRAHLTALKEFFA